MKAHWPHAPLFAFALDDLSHALVARPLLWFAPSLDPELALERPPRGAAEGRA